MATQTYLGYVNNATQPDQLEGIAVIATDATTVTATSTNSVVCPHGLGAALGALTLNGILYGGGPSVSLQATSAGTNGQVLIAATGAPAAFSTLTSSSGTISFTAGANSLDMNAVDSGIVWSVITAASVNPIVKSNGYFTNRSGTVSLTLPSVAAIGDTFRVSNMGAAAQGWQIFYNASQYIRFGNVLTTTTTGSLEANETGASLELVCSVANTEFVVQSSQGNILYI